MSYHELEPVSVKGKAEPLRVWVVDALREDAPGRADEDATPFVGRGAERSLLKELLARTQRECSLQLVTIVGDPGIGKTRLVGDLREHVRAADGQTTWYRGRCLPYGESVTFAPLEEVVREATDVKRSDDREEATTKLERHLGSLALRAEDIDRLRARLAPLLGLVDAEGLAAANREESFAAWTAFLAAEAAQRPTVLVIEDLHWADPSMLDFLDQLGEHLLEVPLLLVGTARPELFDVRRDWGAGKPNSSTVTLSPLTEDDMQHLLAELLVRTVLPPEAQGPLVASAGGNPLYALEFVRMLADQERSPTSRRSPCPETIHGLIAARLDRAHVAPSDRSCRTRPSSATRSGRARSRRCTRERTSARRSPSSAAAADPPDVIADHDGQRRVRVRPRAGARRRIRADPARRPGDPPYRRRSLARGDRGDRLEDRAEQLAHHTTEALALVIASGVREDVAALQDDARRCAGAGRATPDTDRRAAGGRRTTVGRWS